MAWTKVSIKSVDAGIRPNQHHAIDMDGPAARAVDPTCQVAAHREAKGGGYVKYGAPAGTAASIKSTRRAAPRPPPPTHTTAAPRPKKTPRIPMDAAAGGHGGAAEAEAGLDDADAVFVSRRGHRCCGCFWAPPWPSSSSSSPQARNADEWWHGVGEGGAARLRWWRRGVDALMKVREWSELVAGPRWKTFIRRFRRSPRHGGAGGGGGGRTLNYDPLSYALNFDEGHGASSEGDHAGYRDFSARFVAPPGSAKSSMDLCGRDAPQPFHHHHHHPQPLPHSPRPHPAAARG
ncbi:uncharacterized protein LOC133926574 [Phragmites australis]|uniref:uncharacterized protein LOC133926574 n=1 Tax=Phragmites australis TaxID=29695 RepID=UPI002D796F6E|nr:uncharacterized protein LOC133926574 [Phragmites australis]